jgi:tRNA A58 N-methylase Trm61
VLDESEALQHAVKTMEDGEVVVVFYEKLEPLRRVLEKYSAQPVHSINAKNRPRRITAHVNNSMRRSISAATRLNVS